MDRDARTHSYYNVAKPQSLPTRVSRYQRQRMFARFMSLMVPEPDNTIVDIGVTSDRQHDHSNYFESWYPYKAKVTAVGLEDARFLEDIYPGITFVRASALALPFENESFDFVHSSAVIEHVGSMENQIQVLSELWRVARQGIFVTTPNRWFPIEVHTVLPFIHYLPPRQYRAVLREMGLKFFADEKNLNLMSRRSLSAASLKAGIRVFQVSSVRLLGLESNLLLIAKKAQARSA